MKRSIVAGLMASLLSQTALAGPPRSLEFCQVLTLTTGSAYTAGNVVGSVTGAAAGSGIISFTAGSGPLLSGIIQSVRLNFAEAQTAEFDINPLVAVPAHSTFSDKAAPSISTTGCSTAVNCDPFLALPPIKLASASALLGSGLSQYGADQIAGARQFPGKIMGFVITTTGTPTFTNAKAQFCATVMTDF